MLITFMYNYANIVHLLSSRSSRKLSCFTLIMVKPYKPAAQPRIQSAVITFLCRNVGRNALSILICIAGLVTSEGFLGILKNSYLNNQ